VVARLRETLSEPLHIEGTEIVVTASMGVATHPQDGLDMDVLLKHADIALYLAKDAGRNCHRYFKANMEVRVGEDMALEQALRRGLGSDQFYMEFQPVVDLGTNRVCALEALMRWRHPDMGIVPPARFIPVAERSGLIVPLGEQALVAVLAQLRDWQDAQVPCVPVAVNVSALQLERSEFAATVRQRAAEAGVEPRWLHFEIIESALLREQEQIVHQLTQLRELGCEVLIDDFGTGYSALSYLHRLPVDGLKIDRSFVVEMARHGGQSAIIAAIVKIARELRLQVIVAGVETAEQLMLLREYRCAAAQGYFFCKPIPATRCTRLLTRLDDLQHTSESTAVRELRGSDLSLAG
jgi:predicted signal transduction protein with EAL and GGDEF domain